MAPIVADFGYRWAKTKKLVWHLLHVCGAPWSPQCAGSPFGVLARPGRFTS
ncbi:hypothetical protein KFK09_003250 [Dendrobium nobile]|uniref:Uncharacterized protein n=1 Tax=Dendrobium nobile TaxID=94219 RepID=A0A8T3C730_DENNO|nr:hypothetical protein KFK09_003250 [Dendrobium nobile]